MDQTILENIEHLCEMKCHRSAEIISYFSIAFIDQHKHVPKTNHDLKGQLFKILGDIHLHKSENHQSQGYYQQSLLWMSTTEPAVVINSIEKPNLSLNNKQSIQFNCIKNTTSSSVHEVKYNIAINHMANKDYPIALKELESIPISHRNIKIQMELSRLYLILKMNKQAILTLKSVLLSNNLVLEAIEYLIELDVDKDEILTFCNLSNTSSANKTTNTTTTHTTNTKTNNYINDKENSSTKTGVTATTATTNTTTTGTTIKNTNFQIFTNQFHILLVTFLYSIRHGDYSNTLKAYQSLQSAETSLFVTDIASNMNSTNTNKEVSNINTTNKNHTSSSNTTNSTTATIGKNTPTRQLNCIYLMSSMADAAMESGNVLDPYLLFQAIRKIQPLYLTNMDLYGELLLYYKENTEFQNNYKELFKLANEVLSLSAQLPIGWILMALVCESQNEYEKALIFIDKAISCDHSYANSYRIKAKILFQHGQMEQSLSAYLQTSHLKKDIRSYIGVLEAYQALGSWKHIYVLSEECLKLYPTSHSLLLCIGKAYSTGI